MKNNTGKNQKPTSRTTFNLASTILLACYVSAIPAQITTDGSLTGSVATIPGVVNSAGKTIFGVNSKYGSQSGNNLFYSFGAFNINTSEVAQYTNPAGVINVLTRVTGGLSTINGTVISLSDSSVNYWFINPAGWVFGDGSSMMFNGSVHVSTADLIYFRDGTDFVASVKDTTLTTANPVSFGFIDSTIAGINLGANSGITSLEGTASVVAGSITGVDTSLGGVDKTRITTIGGNIDLTDSFFGSAGTTVVEAINYQPNRLTRTAVVPVTGSNIFTAATRSTTSTIDLKGTMALSNKLYIQAGNLYTSSTVNDDSMLWALGKQATGDTTVISDAYLRIDANTVDLNDGFYVASAYTGSTVTAGAGQIDINAVNFNMTNGNLGSLLTDGIGSAGVTNINATDITLDGASLLARTTGVSADYTGTGETNYAAINLNAANNLSLLNTTIDTSIGENGSGIDSVLTSSGSVSLIAGNNLSINGSTIDSTVGTSGTTTGLINMDASNIDILNASNINGLSELAVTATNFNLTDSIVDIAIGNNTLASIVNFDVNNINLVNSSVTSNHWGAGLDIKTDSLLMDNSTLRTIGVENSSIVIAGKSNASASSVSLVNNSIIDTSSTLLAGASDITVSADSFGMDSSYIRAYVRDAAYPPGTGGTNWDNRAGIVTVNANTIDIANNSSVSVSELHASSAPVTIFGSAGSINFNATDISIDNSRLFATSVVNGQGEMHLSATNNLDILGGSRLSAGTRSWALASGGLSVADAGVMEFNAGQMTVSGSTIESSSLLGGDSGNIEITGGSLTLKEGADIRVSRRGIFGLTSAGDIIVNLTGDLNIGTATDTVTNSRIESEALSGAGSAGNILITANNVTMQKGGEISVVTTSNAPDPDASEATIAINAASQVALLDADSVISSSTSGSVNAGEIVINASDIQINGGLIEASTSAAGNAGNIIINDQRSVLNTIDLVDMTLSNGARIATSTTGDGDAGNISITASGTVNVGLDTDVGVISVIESQSTGVSSGSAGVIDILAGNISLNNLFRIQASTESNNTANTPAHINLTANNTLIIDSNWGNIEAYTLGDSDAGNVNITATTIDISQVTINTETLGGGKGGDVRLMADDINIFDSVISAQANASLGNAGDITIEATNYLSAIGLMAFSRTTGLANAGTISLYANNMDLVSGLLETTTWGTGNAGDTQLIATGDINIDFGMIASSTGGPSNYWATGNVGNIDISGNNVTISKGARIETNTNTWASGVIPGSIEITAAENLLIQGEPITGPESPPSSTIISATTLGGSDAGQITLNAKSMQIASGAVVDTSTVVIGSNSGGNAGAITVNATESLQLNNATISSQSLNNSDPNVEHATAGDAGTINITTENLSIVDGGQILTDSISANGVPASINITAGSVDINGTGYRPNRESWFTGTMDEYQSGVFSRAYGSTGAGAITFDVTTLNNSGIISATTFGSGTGGSIDISATDTALIRGTRGSLRSESLGGSGNGGSITVKAPTIRVDQGGTVTTVSTGTGNAGDIKLLASDSLYLDQANIATSSLNAAGGNIKLYATNFLYINESNITAEANGVTPGNDGGNISIDPILLFINSSNIIANANAGNGGNINIVADNMIISPDTVIDASSNTGIDGDVAIETPNQYLGTDAEQETPFLDISGLIRNSCVAEQRQRSSFTTEERNYFYFNPDSYLPSAIDGVIKRKRKKREHQAMLAM